MGQANEKRIQQKLEEESAAREASAKRRHSPEIKETIKDVENLEIAESKDEDKNDSVKLYTDGGNNKDGCYGSWLFILPDGSEGGQNKVDFPDCKTNNQAEYEALERALDAAELLGYKNIEAFSDSLLMVQQVKGLWKINEDNLRDRAEKIVELMKNFDTITMTHVPRTIIEAKLGH